MIRKCCESAEKIIADSRKAYGLGSRQLQGVSLLPFLDKTQLTKIHEQEVLLRNTVNFGEGCFYAIIYCFVSLLFINLNDRQMDFLNFRIKVASRPKANDFFFSFSCSSGSFI